MSNIDKVKSKLPTPLQNGVILNFASARAQEARAELKKFIAGPLNYVLTEQKLRKAVLLEFLDYARPVIGTKWEHKIAPT